MRSLWKQDQIAVIFKGFEVIGITKSWLSEKIPDNLLDITGYKFLRQDRVQDIAGCKKRGGGGILVYVKDDLYKHVQMVYEMSNLSGDIEQLWVLITKPASKPLVVGII